MSNVAEKDKIADNTAVKSKRNREEAANTSDAQPAPNDTAKPPEVDPAKSPEQPPLEPASNSGSSVVKVTAESIVEAILFATDSPLPAAKIAQIMETGDAKSVKGHIDTLNHQYTETGRSFRIDQIAKGYQMLTVPAYNSWVSKVLRARSETKVSPAAMETLAIIAYKQPILRADIEAIRGVAAGEMVNRLREMNLVKIVGRAEELGRPMLYGTTKRFLEVFGLASLDDLPQSDALAASSSTPNNARKPASDSNDKSAADFAGESDSESDADAESNSNPKSTRPSDALRDV